MAYISGISNNIKISGHFPEFSSLFFMLGSFCGTVRRSTSYRQIQYKISQNNMREMTKYTYQCAQ